MVRQSWPATAEILSVFADEIAVRGGTMSDTCHDGVRLFVRSILPAVREVRPDDAIQGGVALRATPEEISVFPYLFRQVCRNGAIMAKSIQSRQITFVESSDAGTTLAAVREAVQACGAAEAFDSAARAVERLATSEVDAALNLLPHLRHSAGLDPQSVMQVMRRIIGGRDQSPFGLMNAITSLARDTPDPERRWRLEELGGMIPA